MDFCSLGITVPFVTGRGGQRHSTRSELGPVLLSKAHDPSSHWAYGGAQHLKEMSTIALTVSLRVTVVGRSPE